MPIRRRACSVHGLKELVEGGARVCDPVNDEETRRREALGDEH